MTSLLVVPTEVFVDYCFPYLDNQGIFSMYKTCKYYSTIFDTKVMSDLHCIYFMVVRGKDLTRDYITFLVARNLKELQYNASRVININNTSTNYCIDKIKFGVDFQPFKIKSNPVTNFSDINRDEFPDLYGQHTGIKCYSYVDDFYDFIYALTPTHNNIVFSDKYTDEKVCNNHIA